MTNNKRILLCRAHMSGNEHDFIKEAFDQNWVVPLGPNVNGFEKVLEAFVDHRENAESLDKRVVALSAGAAGVIHAASVATTDCQPNNNVEALRIWLDQANVEARPLWKPMHRQPVYKNNPAYINGVSESLFKVGICLPAGPYVTDDDVRYIVETIKTAIE